MKLYTATGTRSTREECNALNVGLLLNGHWYDPDKWPYFAIDNGAYSYYSRGIVYDPNPFLRMCNKCWNLELVPDFVVIPDIVGGGRDSLNFSESWYFELNRRYPGWKFYLAVQDGMDADMVKSSPIFPYIAGIFVGGSTDWKLTTMGDWTEFAHKYGLKSHVGRIGPIQRMIHAHELEVDSIDSTTWVQRKGALPKYVNGYRSGIKSKSKKSRFFFHRR